MVRVLTNDPADRGSTTSRVIPTTQHYKVRIKGKVEQSRERISALSYTLV